MTCCCGSIGNRDGIRFCAPDHRYWLDDRELVSVSKVIATCYPKKSWDGVDRAVVERARTRGERVDRYLSEYVATGNVTLNPGEWREVDERVEIAVKWWDQNIRGRVHVQKILHSERDGIAGTADFVIGDSVIDLKNTAQLEKSYKLQMGAYGEYADAGSLHVLHVNPKLYKEGCRLIAFDRDACRDLWRKAVTWFQTIREIET